MSAQRDYAMPQPQPYAPKDEYGKEDIRHIEEVPSDGVDTKDGSASPVDHYTGYPSQTPYTGRWARFREFIREPPIPPGEHITRYPNRWSRIREILKEPAAEFFGTMILIMIGNGVNCQTTLSADPRVSSNPNPSVAPKGVYLSVNMGWAAGVAVAVWISAGYSGGHLNPAVTLAFAAFRDFPWKKVPVYFFAQLMGAICGAAITYANYIHPIDIVEGGRHIRTVPGTASLFATYAAPYVTNVSAFWDEFLGTFVLLMAVCAVTDRNNGPPPAGLVPLCLFFTIFAIGASIGLETGWAINPARDLGPRIFTAMAGYGKEVFNFRHQYWLWCPVMAPFLGGLVGIFVYDTFFFTGSESLLNRPDARARRAHAHALAAERTKPGVPGVEIV